MNWIKRFVTTTSIFTAMNWIKRFVTAKSSSLTYALAYIVLIPVFAIFYNFISADFYHSTAKHEKSVASDLEAIQRGIEDSLNKNVYTQYGNKLVESNGWILKGNKVNLAPLSFKDGIFSCSLVIALERIKNNAPEQSSGTLTTMSFDRDCSPIVIGNRNGKFIFKHITFKNEGFLDFDPYMLLAKPPEGFTGSPPEIRFLKVPITLERQICAYSAAQAGFPADSSGTFWRMMYLSSVTITTLGYGDILPVTDRARMAISLEAILGIVIIGYYLASLATPPDGPATMMDRQRPIP